MRISDWSSDVCSSDLGSFAKAAEVLHRVPSAITYTVQKLESDLGVQLFDRSGKRAKLTDAGQALVERGRSLLREAESLENCVKRVAHGWELQLTLAIDEIVPLEPRSEEHTSELQSLMRNSYAVFCLKKKKTRKK